MIKFEISMYFGIIQLLSRNDFLILFFLEIFWPPKIVKNHRKPTKKVPYRQKMKFWKNFLNKSCIMPLYMLYPNFIPVGALLAAWKLLEWFFKFFTISIFVPNFTLNYEGFSNFNTLPFDNERVFSISVKSDR